MTENLHQQVTTGANTTYLQKLWFWHWASLSKSDTETKLSTASTSLHIQKTPKLMHGCFLLIFVRRWTPLGLIYWFKKKRKRCVSVVLFLNGTSLFWQIVSITQRSTTSQLTPESISTGTPGHCGSSPVLFTLCTNGCVRCSLITPHLHTLMTLSLFVRWFWTLMWC